MTEHVYSYWERMLQIFLKHRLGVSAAVVVLLFCIVGIYAPFLASSKPFTVVYDGNAYFPLIRYLFYSGYYTKRIDIFFNLLMFALPLAILSRVALRRHPKAARRSAVAVVTALFALFLYFGYKTPKDPAVDPALAQQRHEALAELRKTGGERTWAFDLRYMNAYAKLNEVLRWRRLQQNHARISHYSDSFMAMEKQEWLEKQVQTVQEEMRRRKVPEKDWPTVGKIEETILINASSAEIAAATLVPTVWAIQNAHENARIAGYHKQIEELEKAGKQNEQEYRNAVASLGYILDKRAWLVEQNRKIKWEVMPLFRPLHWEEDVGGDQSLNQYLPWWELSRINRKDLIAALIFGVRISLVVGILAVALAVSIGVPIGAFAGYYGGKFDIIVSRLLEIWEAMPIFFMLLLVVAITQSKSIFLVIAVVGVFGWTGFSRYIRGEFFKQRNLSYVESCHAQGFRDGYIMFTHILPNAIPPVLTLLPFAIMGAITSEAGLSFLGLGEEGSCSWGVLMDEGRSAFPAESYLLWPPALLLTTLLVAIAILGDALRDTIDPKMLR